MTRLTPQESWLLLSDSLKRRALAHRGTVPFDAALATEFAQNGISVLSVAGRAAGGLPMFTFTVAFEDFLAGQAAPPEP